MKLKTLAATSVLAIAASTLASAQESGVSHPEALNDTISAAPAAQAEHYQKPSPAVPMATDSAAAAVVTQPAAIVTEPAPAPKTLETVTATPVIPAPSAPATKSVAWADPAGFIVSDDPTSGVVMARPTRPNELAEGTLIHASLDDTLSTTETERGRVFTAHLASDVTKDGRVLIPIGSIVRGRVTEVRAARRFHSSAMMRLQPDTVTLPDGTQYQLAAQVIDFDRMSDAGHDSRVNNEGEITNKSHTKVKLGGVAFTTGTAAVAGAVIAGPAGALVGAGIGAGAGAIWWAKQDHQQVIAQGTVMILNLDRPLFIGTETAAATPNAE